MSVTTVMKFHLETAVNQTPAPMGEAEKCRHSALAS